MMWALLVNTRFESLRKVCVKFLDASASAGLSMLRSWVSFEISVLGCCCCCGGGACNCFGLIMTLEFDAGRWWNGIIRGAGFCWSEDEQHGSSSSLFGVAAVAVDVEGRCSQLLLQLILRRLHRHDVKLAEIGSTTWVLFDDDNGDGEGLL